jgi:NADPH:quinone reductase-like Zn-dependent oxidoreductase
MMKAAVLYTPVGPENFKVETRPIPEPGNGQVFVKVKEFGLNRSELMTRKGYLYSCAHFPQECGVPANTQS